MNDEATRIGDYVLERRIRDAGFAQVFEAHNETSEVEVWLLDEGLFKTRAARRRAVDTITRLAARPALAGTVRWLAAVEDETRVALVQQRPSGGSLRERLVSGSAMAWRDAVEIAAGIAEVLSAAHAAEPALVHGDLQPQHVLVRSDQSVVLQAFAAAETVARLAPKAELPASRAKYISPEQLDGVEATPRSDLYALGLLLFEMLTGEPAFEGQSVRDVEAQRDEGAPELPSELRSKLPEKLERLLASLLTSDPEDRPARAAAVASELRAILSKADTRERPVDDVLATYIERVTQLSNERTGKLDPDDIKGIALDLGMSEGDLAAAEKAAEAHRARGLGYLEHKLWDDAIDQLTHAAALSPLRIESVFALARAFRGRWDARRKRADGLEAQRLARRCIDLDPHHDAAYKLLAELESEIAEHVDATAHPRKELPKATRRRRDARAPQLGFGALFGIGAGASVVGFALLLLIDPLGGWVDAPAQQSTAPATSQTQTPGVPDTGTLGDPKAPIATPSGAEMVLVPGGAAVLGSPGDVGELDEHPQRSVDLKAFYLDRAEVTVADYQRCVDDGICRRELFTAHSGGAAYCNFGAPGRGEHPMNCVSAKAAEGFCAWRSAHDTSLAHRLPTEAEWEKAARGPNGQLFPWGAHTADCSTTAKGGCGLTTTSRTAAFPGDASPFGVRDLGGNVSEWTIAAYEVQPAEASLAPGAAHGFTLRGGNWRDATSRRGADRDTTPTPLGETGAGAFDIGFRCAAVPR